MISLNDSWIQLPDEARADTSEEVYADIEAVLAQDCPHEQRREITPSSARSVAFWWQSPGRVGHVLASFASGVAVSREELLADIERSRDTIDVTSDQLRELDCLSTFVLNYQRP